jgi:hypothetical protein
MVELHFTRKNAEIDEAIDRLIERVGEVHHPEIVREMILAALKAGQETAFKEDIRFLNTAMKEIRYTSKIFSAYNKKRRVTVFGSARTRPDEPVYEMAHTFGQRLAEAGYMVITGGGPGIMQAVNEGAGPDNSFGINIDLPFEQRPNPVLVGNPRLITYKYFFSRKIAFIKETHAVALFPGGFGTLDEAMETLTLLQTGKRYLLPLVLIDEPGGTYWKRWMRFFKEELLKEGYIGESDFYLFECVDSVDAALESINRFYRIYHSMRYVDKKLVIRLTSKISEELVEELNNSFSDILIPGGRIYLSGQLPEEMEETETAGLPRLVIEFNYKDYGRLRRLVDCINFNG